jgi:DNA polymerase III gamma/tau subunit
MKLGLETIERVLDEGYDVYHLYGGLISFLRNIMIMKVYDGLPPFIHMGEEEYDKIARMLNDIEYYEIQNMLSYLLKSEDLIKGFFPKISLEVIYINLYNLAKLRDVEKILDNLGSYEQYEHKEQRTEYNAVQTGHAEQRREHKAEKAEKAEHPAEHASEEHERRKEHAREEGQAHETQPVADIQGFVEYLRKKKPFIGSILENLDLKIENERIIVLLDKNYTFVKNDMNLKEEIKQHLKVYFGKDMGLDFISSGEKRHSLEDYVKETESLFKV